jgi:hypothetical protein
MVRAASQDPTACKVIQQRLQFKRPGPENYLTALLHAKTFHAKTLLTVEPSCKDEARVGQKGGHTYIWAPRGSRPLMALITAMTPPTSLARSARSAALGLRLSRLVQTPR